MKNLVWITAIVIATLAGLYVLWQLRVVALMFLFSLWTAAALRPAMDYLQSRGMRRSLALALVYLAAFGPIVVVLVLAASPLFNETRGFMTESMQAYETAAKEWPQSPVKAQQWLAHRLPNPEELYDALLGTFGWSSVQSLLGLTFGAMGAVVNLLVIVVLSLYWTIDRVHFERLWLSLLSVDQRIEARNVWRAIEAEVGAYLRSETLQCLLAGVVLYAGYRLIGFPHPTLLALVAALCWLIPWFGLVLAALAALLLASPLFAAEGLVAGGIVVTAAIVYTAIVVLALELWVEPRLFQRRRFNSLLIVLVVVALADAFGLVGLILGPPVAAAVQIVGGHILRKRLAALAPEHAPPALEDRLSAVRAAIAGMANPAPGLLNLEARLEAIVREAGELKATAPDAAPLVVYPGQTETTSVSA